MEFRFNDLFSIQKVKIRLSKSYPCSIQPLRNGLNEHLSSQQFFVGFTNGQSCLTDLQISPSGKLQMRKVIEYPKQSKPVLDIRISSENQLKKVRILQLLPGGYNLSNLRHNIDSKVKSEENDQILFKILDLNQEDIKLFVRDSLKLVLYSIRRNKQIDRFNLPLKRTEFLISYTYSKNQRVLLILTNLKRIFGLKLSKNETKFLKDSLWKLKLSLQLQPCSILLIESQKGHKIKALSYLVITAFENGYSNQQNTLRKSIQSVNPTNSIHLFQISSLSKPKLHLLNNKTIHYDSNFSKKTFIIHFSPLPINLNCSWKIQLHFKSYVPSGQTYDFDWKYGPVSAIGFHHSGKYISQSDASDENQQQ